MKGSSEAVKRWKQANRERNLELNRKSYAKVGRKRPVKLELPTKRKNCACGNLAFRKTSDGYVCKRCSTIERKNRKYENQTIINVPACAWRVTIRCAIP